MNRRGEAKHHFNQMKRDVATNGEALGTGKRRECESRFNKALRPVDLVPCAACGLRGHVAGDPDRCLHGDAAAGLGGMQPDQGRIGR